MMEPTESSEREEPGLRVPAWFFLSGVAFCAIALVQRITTPLHCDVAFYLDAARRVLDGARMYVDVIDTNPPLVTSLSIVPVSVAGLLGVSPIVALYVFVAVLAAASLALCRRFLSAALGPSGPENWVPWLALISILLVMPGADFGQREHLLFMLTVPYVVLTSVRLGGRPVSPVSPVAPWLAGVLAGVGVALKPHFALLWIAVELYVAVRSRSIWRWVRPEALLVPILSALHVQVIVVWFRDYFEWGRLFYLSYDAYSCSFSTFLHSRSVKLWLAAGVMLLATKGKNESRGIASVLYAAATGLLVIAVSHKKGWSYQLYPAGAASLMCIVVQLSGTISRLSDLDRHVRGGRVGALTLILVLLLARGAKQAYTDHRAARQTPLRELVEVVRENAEGEPIYVFSTCVWPSFPLVNYSGARWHSRTQLLWLLPALYAGEADEANHVEYHEPSEMGERERLLIDMVVEDLSRHPPRLLLVDNQRPRQGLGDMDFDFLDYFIRDERFARFMEPYAHLQDVGDFAVYKRSAGDERNTGP